MKIFDSDFLFGASASSLVSLIPDDIVSSGGKCIVFVIGAFVSGFVYKAGAAAYDKWFKVKTPDDD